MLLLAVFGLPLLLSMLAVAQDGEAGLPACCRRDGKHHCMMSVNERGKLDPHGPEFKASIERCPCPAGVAPLHPDPLAAPAIGAAIYGDLVSHPTGVAQTEARRRISRDRSHQKRGPPSLTNL